MLDIDLQKSLDDAPPLNRKSKTGFSTRQLLGMAIAVALCSATLGVLTYSKVMAPPKLQADELGKLTVLVSEKTDTIPVDMWSAMERHIGKPASEFTTKDQMAAVKFLLDLIAKHPKETINIW